MKGKLVLEDGSVFYGEMIGENETIGEVVFNTGMTGYQEILTDPSYCGQIVTLTYPLVGNYGIADCFQQSRQSFVKGFIISELCESPNNWTMQGSLKEYLLTNGIVCLHGVDTRAITRKIRSAGTMRGIIVPAELDAAQIEQRWNQTLSRKVVAQVTTPHRYKIANSGPHVVVMDFGIKKNILLSLQNKGCNLTVVPADTSFQEIKALQPDGVFLSNGPGDPKDVPFAIETIRSMIGRWPMFGICLGHQLLALAFGADTYKMKFGHRGSNHPVKNLASGRVHITSQNHGYAVQEESLADKGLIVTHRAVNDGSVEGMKHQLLPIFSVQYHPEAAPGPDDNVYLFDQFMELLAKEVALCPKNTI